jgi:Cu-processing system permease protein
MLAIARRELMEAVRSRWLVLAGGLFGLLALALSVMGMRSVGVAGFGGFSRTAIGLLNLVLYLVPLMALLLAINSMAAEREEGPLEVLLAQPITRRTVVFGKFAGLAAAIGAALCGGFGVAGLAIGMLGGAADAGGYALLVLRAIGLGLAFLSLGLWIASAASSRLRALTWGLLLWFTTVLLYDLLIVGLTAVLGGTSRSHARSHADPSRRRGLVRAECSGPDRLPARAGRLGRAERRAPRLDHPAAAGCSAHVYAARFSGITPARPYEIQSGAIPLAVGKLARSFCSSLKQSYRYYEGGLDHALATYTPPCPCSPAALHECRRTRGLWRCSRAVWASGRAHGRTQRQPG